MADENNNITMPETTAAAPSPIVTEEQKPVESPIVQEEPTFTEAAPETTQPAAAPTGDKNTPEWAQRRINDLTAKRYEAERRFQDAEDGRLAAESRAAELLAQIGKPPVPATPGQAPPAPTQAPQLSETEIERRANEKAQQIARVTEFNKACNSIAEVGKAEFKDTWVDALRNLEMVGAVGPKVSTDFLETAIELRNPAAILHHLGQNPEEAARIAALPSKRMAMEMARVEAQINAPKAPVIVPVSAAPAPVIPVGGAAKAPLGTLDDPTLKAEDWFALRQKEVEAKRNRYGKR